MQLRVDGGASLSEQGVRDVLRRLDWNDLRHFLAVAELGSIRKAAGDLGIGGATISRSLDRLEGTLGFKLFNRLPEGLKLTDNGRAIMNDVQGIDRATVAIVRRSHLRGEPLRGVVRLAVTEGLGNYWLLPKLVEFTASNRLLTVELSCTMEPTDVARLQSDISVQFHRPTNPDLVVVKLGRLHTHAFASIEYERRNGIPRNIEDVRNHRIIQQVSPILPVDALQRGLRVASLEGIVGIRTNTSSGVLYAVERHAGIGWLPSYALAFGGRFVAVDLETHHFLDIYMTYHPDVRRSEHHMAVIEWVRRAFDPILYPCFGDEFIHPVDLIPLMSGATHMLGNRGYLAMDPSGQSHNDDEVEDFTV